MKYSIVTQTMLFLVLWGAPRLWSCAQPENFMGVSNELGQSIAELRLFDFSDFQIVRTLIPSLEACRVAVPRNFDLAAVKVKTEDGNWYRAWLGHVTRTIAQIIFDHDQVTGWPVLSYNFWSNAVQWNELSNRYELAKEREWFGEVMTLQGQHAPTHLTTLPEVVRDIPLYSVNIPLDATIYLDNAKATVNSLPIEDTIATDQKEVPGRVWFLPVRKRQGPYLLRVEETAHCHYGWPINVLTQQSELLLVRDRTMLPSLTHYVENADSAIRYGYPATVIQEGLAFARKNALFELEARNFLGQCRQVSSSVEAALLWPYIFKRLPFKALKVLKMLSYLGPAAQEALDTYIEQNLYSKEAATQFIILKAFLHLVRRAGNGWDEKALTQANAYVYNLELRPAALSLLNVLAAKGMINAAPSAYNGALQSFSCLNFGGAIRRKCIKIINTLHQAKYLQLVHYVRLQKAALDRNDSEFADRINALVSDYKIRSKGYS